METAFPFILQNIHRYFLYLAFFPLFFLWVDAFGSFVPNGGLRVGFGASRGEERAGDAGEQRGQLRADAGDGTDDDDSDEGGDEAVLDGGHAFLVEGGVAQELGDLHDGLLGWIEGRRKRPGRAASGRSCLRQAPSALATLVKTAFSCVPTLVTAVMMTMAISAAMRPYSMAVTPSSSRVNFLNICVICMESSLV